MDLNFSIYKKINKNYLKLHFFFIYLLINYIIFKNNHKNFLCKKYNRTNIPLKYNVYI